MARGLILLIIDLETLHGGALCPLDRTALVGSMTYQYQAQQLCEAQTLFASHHWATQNMDFTFLNLPLLALPSGMLQIHFSNWLWRVLHIAVPIHV